MRLLIATTVKGLATALKLKGTYDVAGVIEDSSLLINYFNNNNDVDTLLVTEKIDGRGSIIDILVRLKIENPLVRIIYLSSSGLDSEYHIDQLYQLVKNNIFDIYYGSSVDLTKLCDLLDHPRTRDDCEAIIKAKEETEERIANVKENERKTEVQPLSRDSACENVYLVSSVKPGTGKSFVASNLACTLALNSKRKVNGHKPRVLLLEGDLQTLSVSTIFGIRNNDYNLTVALDKIHRYMEIHSLDEWYSDNAISVKDVIDRCCVNVKGIEGLYVLEGHDFSFKDISKVDPSDYYYLVEYLSTRFDVVIVDANSSLQHKTTDPLLQLSRRIYLVLTTDFNNIKLNLRYREALNKLGVLHKTKYVLNKAMVGEEKKKFLGDFRFTDEDILSGNIQVDHEIPLIDIAVIYNSTYKHEPIALDETFATLIARIRFLKMAKEIYPLEGIESYFKEVEELRKFAGKK